MLTADMPLSVRRRIAILAISSLGLLLTACSWSSRPDPAELLSRAVRTTQGLHSVAFDLTASVRFWSLQLAVTGDLTASGALVSDGQLIRAAGAFQGELGAGDNTSPATVQAEIAHLANGEVDLRLQSASGPMIDLILPASLRSAATGQWRRIIRGSSGTVVNPEPQVLDAQANALAVTDDLGRTQLRGVNVVHYQVTVDPEKLRAYLSRAAENRGERLADDALQTTVDAMQANGELWIDPATALVHRVRWSVSDPVSKNLTLELTLDLHDHDLVLPIEAPTDVSDWPGLRAVLPSLLHA